MKPEKFVLICQEIKYSWLDILSLTQTTERENINQLQENEGWQGVDSLVRYE